MAAAESHTVSNIFSRALAAHRAGDVSQAERLYRDALRIDPAHVDAWHLLGVARYQQRDPAGARENIQRAMDLGGRAASMHGNMGGALRELGRLDEAERHLRQAIELSPQTAGFHFNLGNCLRDAGRPTEAVASYRAALQCDPQFADACNNMGQVLRTAGRNDEAEAAFLDALRIHPDFAEAAFNLAGLYRTQDRLEDAAAAGRIAVRARPGYFDAWVNLGYTLDDQGRTGEAAHAYETALQLQPDSAEAHFNRALAWLRAGGLSRGWDEYEWRLRKRNEPLDPASWSNWELLPRPIEGVVVLGEQGIGDEVMFASCLPDVVRQSRRCLATCDARLRPLFARSFPDVEFQPRESGPLNSTGPRFSDGVSPTVTIPLGSLPRFLRRDAGSFPAQVGYLTPHPVLAADWRRRFDALGSACVVGISWRGGRDPIVRRRRSIPTHVWSPLFGIPGVQFVNLQYGATAEEFAEFESIVPGKLRHWSEPDPLIDLDGFAAQVAALDLVISADNATVHLAGGLGNPVWTLLPAACDWRWGIAGDRSPWYPSMTLFRQQTPGDWHSVIRQTAARLAAYASHSAGEFANPG